MERRRHRRFAGRVGCLDFRHAATTDGGPMSSRRDFLRTLAAAPIALAAPSWAAPPAGNRLLVMVYLYGGNDGYNTWVPYADSLYYRVRPNIAVPRDAVLKVTPTHGFHP